jgi:enoyl-CoA hydratase/carnithine racemase
MELTTITVPAQLDAASVERVSNEFAAACVSSAVRVVALRGASADTFCLGLAIGDVIDAGGQASTSAFSDLLALMHDSPKPLLAIVDGRAIGGGLGLACACDRVIATSRATFGLPELLWGLVPAVIWPVVTDRMAPHVARQWTLTAHSRNAAEALAAGVIDDLVDVVDSDADADTTPARLDAATRRAVRALGRLEPEALRRLRHWSRASRSLTLPAALAGGAEITASMMRNPDVRRRWRAFAEGEAPWSE